MAEKLPFDRDLYRKGLKRFSSFTPEEIESRLDMMEYDRRNLKTGSNVLRVDYYQHLLSDQEIHRLENVLLTQNLELSYFDKTRSPQASFVEYLYHLYVSTSIQDEVVKNIVWDAVAGTIMLVLRGIKRLLNAPKNGAIGLTFEMATPEPEKIRKVTINITPDIDEKVVDVTLSHIPSIIREFNIETRKARQVARFIDDTVTLQSDGTFSISTFKSPEYWEEDPKKKTGKFKKKISGKGKKRKASKKKK